MPANPLTEPVVLTAEVARQWHMRETMHLNGGKEWFGYVHQCVEQPRLSRRDKYLRKSKSVQSTWRVDGHDCADFDDAVEALNVPVVLSDDERAALTRWRDDFDAEWSQRGKNYEMLRALSDKGMLDGRNGVTPAGLAALTASEDKADG